MQRLRLMHRAYNLSSDQKVGGKTSLSLWELSSFTFTGRVCENVIKILDILCQQFSSLWPEATSGIAALI